MGLGKLVWRNLLRRKLRTVLTIASLVVALFLLCTLRTLVTTIAAGSEAASGMRLVVQSAVSLFVDLPLSYQAKIEGVDGIERVCKWQWFGGYYQEERNQFAQFAVDPEQALAIYPEMELIEGSAESFLSNRRGALVGEGLIDRFGWKLGDTVPIIPTIFPHPDGDGVAWEFEVAAIYRPTQRNFDAGMILFHWDYFEKTLESGPDGSPSVGTYVLKLEPGAEATTVARTVDALFAGGPQRVQTTSEAEFQAQFVSMMGNIPFFVSTIGGGVLAAILLAVVNTMLMSGREQTRDIGILKALGFTDAATMRLLAMQSVLLCVIGGGLGLLFANRTEAGIAKAMGAFFPGYKVEPETYLLGAAITLGMGVFAGLAPAWRAGKLRTVEALASEE